jgi:acetolactate synthase-1/2/3 large subunit
VNETLPSRSGGQVLIDALLLHGVDTVFAVPGESYLDALDALYGARNRIRLITCRQEGGAAFMAEAYGKATGRLGVCFVTRGPGACNASIGVHAAMQDSTPMLLLVGQVARGMLGREAFQEIDFTRMFAPPIAKMAVQIDDPARIPEVMHNAVRTAMSGRPGPVVVALPEDMLTETCAVADGKPYQAVRAHPGAGQIDAMRVMLAAAARPVMILGGGGWSEAARADMGAFAAANGLPTTVSFRRQDLIDNTAEVYIGDLASSVEPKLVQRIKDADLLLVVGARLGEMTTRGYTTIEAPAPRQSLIHVQTDGAELGRVFQPDLAILSGMEEFAAAARAMAPVDGAKWNAWRESGRADYVATQTPNPYDGALNLAEVVRILKRDLPEDTIVTLDAGNFSGWAHRYWTFRHPRTQLGPTVGAMGYGVPAGIAAKVAHPERCVLTFVGDGGFMMTGQELATAMHHQLDPIILLFNNGLYGTIRMHQEREYPDRIIGTDLTNPDFAALARAYGAHGETVERTEDFAPALARARESGKAAVIDLRMDANIITTSTTLDAIRDAAKARAAR